MTNGLPGHILVLGENVNLRGQSAATLKMTGKT